jgi:hypothetical protein
MEDGVASREQITDFLDEAAWLWLQRDHAIWAPNYSMAQLSSLDEALAAQLDGARVNGETAWSGVRPVSEKLSPPPRSGVRASHLQGA